MTIQVVKNTIIIPGRPEEKYITRDGRVIEDLDEAVEWENKLNEADTKPVVIYEQIWTIQEAINKAVAQNRVVRFLWEKDNASIKKGIVDIKGCKLRKPDNDSFDVAVIPPSIDPDTFDFNEVK